MEKARIAEYERYIGFLQKQLRVLTRNPSRGVSFKPGVFASAKAQASNHLYPGRVSEVNTRKFVDGILETPSVVVPKNPEDGLYAQGGSVAVPDKNLYRV